MTTPMTLDQLLDYKTGVAPVHVAGLQRDSRLVKPGDLYIAVQGANVDGHDFIQEAVDRGAVAVLLEDVSRQVTAVPCVVVPNLAIVLGVIADRFYQSPSHSMRVIGVTGTNGKTSCTHFLAQCLSRFNIPCGVLGTLGTGFLDNLTASGLTTPDAISVQQSLARLREDKAQVIAMEVSSHGLDQHRVSGVAFDTGIFTNLTQDHLDYHASMAAYGEAKRQLFLMPGLQHMVVNVDDAFGLALLSLAVPAKKYGISLRQQSVAGCELIYAEMIKTSSKGISAMIKSPWGEGRLTSKLLGEFNLSNLLAVLSSLCLLNIPFDQVLRAISQVETVPGRMQSFGGQKLPQVIIDYSHTPDALKQALTALRTHCSGKIWCVFGCGGDRDKTKRKAMGEVAEHFSDQLVITNDNPRTEDPQAIVDDIMQGLLCPWAAEIELDRGTAIAHAIDCAGVGDMVLVAGKGHEPYQLIGKERIPFSDIEHVKQHVLRKRVQRNEERRDDAVS